jgi:hypothetical protein
MQGLPLEKSKCVFGPLNFSIMPSKINLLMGDEKQDPPLLPFIEKYPGVQKSLAVHTLRDLARDAESHLGLVKSRWIEREQLE